jgi:hypothetical protein
MVMMCVHQSCAAKLRKIMNMQKKYVLLPNHNWNIVVGLINPEGTGIVHVIMNKARDNLER